VLKPIPVNVYENSINPLVFTSETHIINLKLDNNEEHDCIIKDVQFDPVTDKIVHFDLQGLISGEKIEIEVPVVTKGSSIGVRDGGLLQMALHRLLVECDPADIPEHIEIDITDLKMGHGVHIRDLNMERVSFLQPEDTVIVSVAAPRAAVETTPAGEGEAISEPEVIAKGKEKQEEE
jgi:large subunit ribosomal protein L25